MSGEAVRFIEPATVADLIAIEHASSVPNIVSPEHDFFRDHRRNYLAFVANTDEKNIVAARIIEELYKLVLDPSASSLNIFDAGIGDGTILTKVISAAHAKYPDLPFYIVGKEISGEDIRIVLQKMKHVFVEHPQTVLVLNNLHYAQSPWLLQNDRAPEGDQWKEWALTGNNSYQFDGQFNALDDQMPDWEKPAVVAIYRQDQKALLQKKGVLPPEGDTTKLAGRMPNNDLVIASQPYQLQRPTEFKAGRIIWPLAKSLRPGNPKHFGGRLVGIHSKGSDPAARIIRGVWKNHEPFPANDTQNIMGHVASLIPSDERAQFGFLKPQRLRYHLRKLAEGAQSEKSLSTPAIQAAWGAAIYVAQMSDAMVAGVSETQYKKAVVEVLDKYRGHKFDKYRSGCWFYDSVYVIMRQRLQRGSAVPHGL